MSIKSQELKPTKENLINCIKGDLIERNAALKRFVSLCNTIDGNCSIAIDGKWGDGKTFFVKQAKLVLDSYNGNISEGLTEDEKSTVLSALDPNDSLEFETFSPQVCVYYDAWSNDNDVDPLLSIVYEIVKTASTEFDKIDNSSYLDKAIAVFDLITGMQIKELMQAFKKEDLLETIHKQKELFSSISGFFDSLLPERGNRLIIIVDELDRCRPSYAVQLLERIKHYFVNDNITFIFAINTIELQHSLKKFYGEGFDACRYLDRFFDLCISLPAANMEKYYRSICDARGEASFKTMCHLVLSYCGLTLRETSRFIHVVNIAVKNAIRRENRLFDEYAREYDFGYWIIVPLIIGLKMTKSDVYYEFINGVNPKPLIDVFVNYRSAPQMCEYLLNESETFGNAPNGIKHVELEDKLREAYNGIFGSGNQNTVIVGSCKFNSKVKEAVLDTATMISRYATFSDD